MTGIFIFICLAFVIGRAEYKFSASSKEKERRFKILKRKHKSF